MEQPNDLSPDFLVAALRREAGAFRSAVGAVDLTAKVPSCPEWTVRQLVGHLGRVYDWVRLVIESGEKPSRKEAQPRGEDVREWFDEVFAGLMAAIDAIEPDVPVWNWARRPPVAAFWPRRMAHETAVHRWDAQLVGGRAEPVETQLAADGVSEVLDTWLPAGRGTVSNGAQGLVRLNATDEGGSWLVRLRPQGVTLLDEKTVLDGAAEAHTGVAGTASDLMLALWGRIAPSALAVEGDPSRFEALRTG